MEQLSVVVLAKQVPDTRNVGKDAMRADGTVNRAALPAIFNPEDLYALEQALRIKDAYPGTRVTVLTMGPGRAADVLREGLYRGADAGVLLTDRAFAGADTLATSYALMCALRELKPDLVFSGRQAIDGDTAQVGPQVAEKLGWPQITFVEAVESFDGKVICARRRVSHGVEVLESPLPVLLTVTSSAPECRPRNAKLVMQWKRAAAPIEKVPEDGYVHPALEEWTAARLAADPGSLGLAGSPTKVKSVENVVFQVKESRRIEGSREAIDGLVVELLAQHTIG